MSQKKYENALLTMHRQTLARGGNVRVHAGTFNAEELTELVRGTDVLKYHSRIVIVNSKLLSEREKKSIMAGKCSRYQVFFA